MSQPAIPQPITFNWLEPGLLAGATLPRTVADMQAIADLGIKLLVSLTAERTPDTNLITKLGLQSHYLPISDYGIPDVKDAVKTCALIQGFLDNRKPVLIHCNAGKGRTGTMLATQMIWQGKSAADAIRYIRSKNPEWIETTGQEQFLSDLAQHLRPR